MLKRGDRVTYVGEEWRVASYRVTDEGMELVALEREDVDPYGEARTLRAFGDARVMLPVVIEEAPDAQG